MAAPDIASTLPTSIVAGQKKLNGTSSQAVKTGAGYLAGVFVASGSSPTIKFWDSTAGSGDVIVNTFTPALGWNPCPFQFETGLYITVGGTIDYTVSYT